MAPKAPRRQVFNVQEILTSICTKWGLLVLYELARGARRPGELRRTIGVSQKMLTQTLRMLERDRLVRRTIYPIAASGLCANSSWQDAHAAPIRALSLDGEAPQSDPAGVA